MCGLLERSFADAPTKALLEQLNLGFNMPQRPFKRVDYKDAIAYLNEHNIAKEYGVPHKIGDAIAEAAERKMIDQINVPIFLTGFPREIKVFYMKRIEGDEGFMEYVYVLMPGVSEVVGGRMRISHSAELLEAVQACVLHTDQRKYGTLQHASFLGLREDTRL